MDDNTQAPITPAEPAPPPEPAAEPLAKEPPNRRDIIAKAFQKAPPAPRQPTGQFAPKPPDTPPARHQDATKTPPNRPAMPKSLKKDLQTHWDAAPVELLSAIEQREADYEKGVGGYRQKAQEAEDLLNEFKPYEMMLRTEGATPKQAIASLLQTAAILRTGTPVQKAYLAAQMIRQFNVPLDALQGALSGNAPQAPLVQPAQDPQLGQLSQQVQRLSQLQQQQIEAQALAAVQEFAANPEHKHFEAVQERMLSLLEHPQILGSNAETLPEREKLKLAYDMAIRLDPEVSKLVLADEQAKQQTTQQVIKAKQAAVQVTGAPGSGPAPKVDPKDRREVIRNAFSALR